MKFRELPYSRGRISELEKGRRFKPTSATSVPGALFSAAAKRTLGVMRAWVQERRF